VRQAKLVQTSWIIQPGQRLTTRPERNSEHKEATNCAEPEERQVVDHNASEGMEPRNYVFALGQGFVVPEASIAACATGEGASDMPGSEAMVGNRIACTGTWESHIVPKEASNELKRRRRKYGDMAVGLTHSRGVDGVMPIESPCSLEGVSSKTQRDE
jgi:hypothetical protein